MTRLIFDRKRDLLAIIPDDRIAREQASILARIDSHMRQLAFADVIVDTRQLETKEIVVSTKQVLRLVAMRSFGRFAVLTSKRFAHVFDFSAEEFPLDTTVRIFHDGHEANAWLAKANMDEE